MSCVIIDSRVIQEVFMLFDRKMAVNIIKELEPIINFDINLIGNDGIIIASTNSNREGTLHSGAVKLVKGDLDQLIIYNDDEYEGCRQGINLPIMINGHRIAIVGITGKPEDAIKYGNIVKKMTEMLIQYNIEHIQSSTRNKFDLILINDLIHGNFNTYMDDIQTRITQSGLKPEGPFSVAIFRLTGSTKPMPDDDNDIIFINTVKESLIRQLASHHILCTETNDSYIAVSNMTCGRFSRTLSELKSNMEKTHDLSLICYIGNERNDYREINRSYNEALILSSYTPPDIPGIYQFNMANLDIAIDQIPSDTKELIWSNVFKNCTENDIDDFCDFIICYFEFNGSLVKIADYNYQHKNTVQYKIAKLKKKTSLDIRNYRDMFILYIAAIYYITKESEI